MVPPLTFIHKDDDNDDADGENNNNKGDSLTLRTTNDHHTPPSQNESVCPSSTSSYRHLLLQQPFPPAGVATEHFDDDPSVCPSSVCTLTATAGAPPSLLSSPLLVLEGEGHGGSSFSVSNNNSTSYAAGGYSSPTRHTQRVVVSPLISDGSGFDVGSGFDDIHTNASPHQPRQQLLTTSTTMCGSISRSIRTSGGGSGAYGSSAQSNLSTHPLSRN